MRILIVDDEPLIRRTTRIALEADGHEMVEASNGARALQRVDETAFDGVFLDLELGAENGLDVLAKLRSRHPALPVVMFTAFANIATAVEAMRRGASDFVAEPFTPDLLRGILVRIGKSRALSLGVPSLESEFAPDSASAESGIEVGGRVTIDELESEHIRRVLATARNYEEAARTLGIDPATLYRKRQKLGLL